jgi:hypothetical protein
MDSRVPKEESEIMSSQFAPGTSVRRRTDGRTGTIVEKPNDPDDATTMVGMLCVKWDDSPTVDPTVNPRDLEILD